MTFEYVLDSLIVQPITSCNLDCAYCYLPERKTRHLINGEVIAAIGRLLDSRKNVTRLAWHCGEPLLTPIGHFRDIVMMLRRDALKQSVQTNATLINEEWCRLFRDFDIAVGVSIDGNEQQNGHRLYWNGKASFEATRRGIDLLNRFGVPFHVICVVHDKNIDDPGGLYRFLRQTGCYSAAFNIEEQENLNVRTNHFTTQQVTAFWTTIFKEWKSHPDFHVREMDHCLAALAGTGNSNEEAAHRINLLPTIAYNGDIVILSPEFQNAKSKRYKDFVIGNILYDDIDAIENKLNTIDYLHDFEDGIRNCSRSCEYFDWCGGAYASNKFFENGTLSSTATNFCNNSVKLMIHSVLETINPTLP